MTYNFWREIIGLPDPMLPVHCSVAENVNKQKKARSRSLTRSLIGYRANICKIIQWT